MAGNSGYMLTTWDNPFNPSTHWDEWYQWDTTNGYHTNALLARVGVTSSELTDELYNQAVEQAIDFIIEQDPITYKKIQIESD